MRKILLMLLILITSCFQVFGAGNLLTCNFKSGSCSSDESAMFFANKNFVDASGNVLSSNVALTSDTNYDKSLCCKINPSVSGLNLGKINVTYVNSSLDCFTDSEELMYFTESTNARVGFADNITNFIDYPKKMCVRVPNGFSRLNLVLSTDDYSSAGYTCLYRTNSLVNGHVSACNATFGGSNQYSQIVWAKLVESSDSLKCNSDCTSKLDGRVYEACSTKIPECKLVSPKCDGSVYGAWVKYDSNTEIQCSAPWTIKRELTFTENTVEVTSVDPKCSNIIQRKYSAMLNNELVTMSLYMCESNE